MLLRRAASEVAFLIGCCHWRIVGAPSNNAEVKLPEKRSNTNFVQHASNLAIKLPTSTMTLTLVKRIHVRSAARFRSHVQLPMSRRRTAQTPYHLLCYLTHHWHRAENLDMLWFCDTQIPLPIHSRQSTNARMESSVRIRTSAETRIDSFSLFFVQLPLLLRGSSGPFCWLACATGKILGDLKIDRPKRG